MSFYFCGINAPKCNCWILSVCLVCNKQLSYFSSVDVTFYILTSNVQLIPFLCILASNWYDYYFYLSHSDRCMIVIPHCNFNLHFPSGSWCWISFCVFINHLCTHFGDTSLPVFANVLIRLGFFVVYKSFAGYMVFKYSLSVCNLSFHFLKEYFEKQTYFILLRYNLSIFLFLNVLLASSQRILHLRVFSDA